MGQEGYSLDLHASELIVVLPGHLRKFIKVDMVEIFTGKSRKKWFIYDEVVWRKNSKSLASRCKGKLFVPIIYCNLSGLLLGANQINTKLLLQTLQNIQPC